MWDDEYEAAAEQDFFEGWCDKLRSLFIRPVKEFDGNFDELIREAKQVLEDSDDYFDFTLLQLLHFAVHNRLPIDPVIKFLVNTMKFDINEEGLHVIGYPESDTPMCIAMKRGAPIEYIKGLLALGAQPEVTQLEKYYNDAELQGKTHPDLEELTLLLYKAGADFSDVENDELFDFFELHQMID